MIAAFSDFLMHKSVDTSTTPYKVVSGIFAGANVFFFIFILIGVTGIMMRYEYISGTSVLKYEVFATRITTEIISETYSGQQEVSVGDYGCGTMKTNFDAVMALGVFGALCQLATAVLCALRIQFPIAFLERLQQNSYRMRIFAISAFVLELIATLFIGISWIIMVAFYYSDGWCASTQLTGGQTFSEYGFTVAYGLAFLIVGFVATIVICLGRVIVPMFVAPPSIAAMNASLDSYYVQHRDYGTHGIGHQFDSDEAFTKSPDILL